MSNKLLPAIVWRARIRKAWLQGEFFDIECASNVKTSISTSEDTVKLSCGRWESVTFEKPSWTITLKVIKTKNPTLLGKLLGLNVAKKQAGTNTITDLKQTFDENGVIELTQRSNDDKWVTSLVIKSLDGKTTYAKDTDYTVAVVDNKTKITIKGSRLTPRTSVLVSGTLKQNASKEVIIERVQRIKEKFEIELFGEETETKNMMTLLASPVELNSEYLLEMFDVFSDGEPAGAELSFVLTDNGKIVYRDEII